MSSASNDQGRAYEFICLHSLHNAITKIRPSQIVINSSYEAAERAWNILSHAEQALYSLSAASTIDTIFAMEPNIVEPSTDILSLHLQTDQHGEIADVRDIIIERKNITWEIGLSIKHKQFSSFFYNDKNRGAFGEMYYTYDLKNKRNICHIILDSEFEHIDYNGTKYPIRHALFEGMNMYIATESFDRALFDEKTGLPTSREAEFIDDTIFYFVQDNEIYLPQHKLLQLLKNQVA
ncbi:MAG: HaeIII family restriction endonuclease [Bacteroidaceae bacterium]|nr:HaeIII family restriction endonuclease [Bacteroidaceae bacterium]